MPAHADLFDLGSLRLRPGEGRRLDLEVALEPFELGAERYDVTPAALPVVLDVSRMNGDGWSLRLRLRATLEGPCMRCLEAASPAYDVDAWEIDQADSGPELDSPYVTAEVLDVGAWARDALALALPPQVLCTPECRGLCPDCGVNLNRADADHGHERAPDPRWAALRELRLD